MQLEPCLFLSWVYCHKGCYFLYYNYLDSYPDGLGLDILHGIPHDASKEEFEEWVKLT
jgi:hypothetical protein